MKILVPKAQSHPPKASAPTAFPFRDQKVRKDRSLFDRFRRPVCPTAGVYTKNSVKAAPLVLAEKYLKNIYRAQAVVSAIAATPIASPAKKVMPLRSTRPKS
jgi:N-acetylglutamate synthase/N-acetylornithine aminotransferase